MKNTVKTLILLLAIAVGIGGILIYATTRVGTPKIPIQVNQYKVDLLKNYENLSKTKKETQSDSIYTVVIDKIDVYKAEDKITSSEADINLNEFMNVYAPLFIENSFDKFKKSVWNDNNHNNMLTRSKELKLLKHSDKSPVLSKESINSLNLIDEIIADYHQAQIIANNTSFRSIAEAQSIISKAEQYANNEYLSNCKELSNSLNTVKSKIAKSHYEYINNKVEGLSYYSNYSKSDYYNLIPDIQDAINKYNTNAMNLYGFKENEEYLTKKINTLIEKAMRYYNY